MKSIGRAVTVLALVITLFGCGNGTPQAPSFAGDYSALIARTSKNTLTAGDVITESNNYGAFCFEVDSTVKNERIDLTGAAGSPKTDNPVKGGTGGHAVVDMAPESRATKEKPLENRSPISDERPAEPEVYGIEIAQTARN